MNLLENCLLLLGLPFTVIVAGYWLAARLTALTAPERLAVASLAGLALLLWNVATVNFFLPLGDPWVWLCVWPVAVTLLSPTARRSLVGDVTTVAFNRRGALAALLAVAFLLLLLWPLLTRPALVYYDGTSNHDAFFWISAAEHLKRHTYMEFASPSPTHALTGATGAIIGWRPAWGRMGAEGLLAATSSLVHLAPVKLYLCATAGLFIPWVAAVFLAVRTFISGRLGIVATLALIALQPLFVFFHGNTNLPNLLGALMAAGTVIATERSLRPGPGRGVWLALLALSFHGLLCSYPEMIPFVVMPGGLLWLRVWVTPGPRAAWRAASLTALAWIAGVVLNPASSIRAWTGFFASYDTAKANENWANLFAPLRFYEYIPGLATLSIGTCHNLGIIAGGFLSLALLVGVGLALSRATDRIGALFTLSGSAVLLGWTLYFNFSYGWQKTVQFGGAFWAAVLPVAIVDVYARLHPANLHLRRFARFTLLTILALFVAATILSCLDGHKWSRRKILTQDWFTLREYAREHLRGAPILVDGSSFRMAFFHGMWSTYFLADNPVYFAARGEENGGYLRGGVANEATTPLPPIAGYLVSRDWANTFDANSTSFFLGDTVALLQTANRVKSWTGLYPDNGSPDAAEKHVVLELEPHSRSELVLDLLARFPLEWPEARWNISVQADGEPPYTAEVSGPAPWHIAVPLTAKKLNRIEFTAVAPAGKATQSWPFAVRNLRVRALP